MKFMILSIFVLLAFFGQSQLDSTSFRVRPLTMSSIKQYVSVPTSSSLQLDSNFTLECWVFVPVNGAQQEYLIETYTSGNGGYVLRTNYGQIMAYAMGASSPVLIGSGSIIFNEWNHLAVTFDDNTNEMKLYLNGVLDQVGNLNVDNYCTTSVVNIGARGDDNNVNSNILIDDVRIWNVTRSESEIIDNVSNCLNGNEAGLVLYYDFEDLNINGVVLDKSSFANNGTIVGNIDPVADGAFQCCIIDNEITLNGSVLTATQLGASYQWVDCNNGNSAIVAATNQTFMPTLDGNYACIINNGNCEIISDCAIFSTLGINEISSTEFSVFPNPTNHSLTILTNEMIKNLQIYDLAGSVVQTETSSIFSVEMLTKGIYIIQIETENGRAITRFIKD